MSELNLHIHTHTYIGGIYKQEMHTSINKPKFILHRQKMYIKK